MGHRRYGSGFTLLELMIALALGLIIVAAGFAVFLSSSRSLGLQSGMSELQQNANFGLSLVIHDLRHTNLNTVSAQKVNNITNGSGIIFSKDNLPAGLQNIDNLENEYVTLQNKDTDSTKGKSDRLVIQYVPSTDNIVNCEGGTISAASSKIIVQRYYIAQSPQQVDGEPIAYSLYCDAGYYVAGSTTIEGLNNHAQQLMQRVDTFKIRLGVKNPAGNLRYMTINEYIVAMKNIRDMCSTPIDENICAKNYLNVVSIEVGLLSRSTGTIGSDAKLNTKSTFDIAGSSVALDGDAAVNKRYLRQSVNQVVAIRNTLGASQ